MAGTICDFLENNSLDWYFGKKSITVPSTHYIGLSTTTITDAGGNITEPTFTGYARVAVTNNATTWPDASSSVKSNGIIFEFPEDTNGTSAVTDFFISDADTSGNISVAGALTTGRSITVGVKARFAIGAFTITYA